MVATEQKVKSRIEEFLLRMGLAFEEIGDNMWVIHKEEDNVDNIVLIYDDPLVIIRVKAMEIPANNKEAFFRKLLILNTTSLTHGAYGLEENYVVLVDTLEAENLDYNELQASIDSIIMALSQDYKDLSSFFKE